MSTQKPQSAPLALSPLSIARMLWKKKGLILIVWVLVGGAGVGVIWRLPAIYRSEALILVDSQKIPEKFVSSTVSTDLQDRLATINQEILSSRRLKKIIEDYGLYREAKKTKYEEEILEMMRSDISVNLVKGWTGNRPGAFKVGYEGPDPSITAQVANRIANLYIEENLKTREVQAEGTAEFIDTQLSEAKKTLDDMESAVSVYKLKHNGELPEQQSALLGALAGLQTQLEANRDALNRAQQNKSTLELNLQTAEDALGVVQRGLAVQAASGVASDGLRASVAQAPRRQSEILEDQLAAMRMRGLTDRHPDVKALLDNISKQKALEESKEDRKKTAAAAPVTTTARTDEKQALEDKPAPAPPNPAKVVAANPTEFQLNARIRDLTAQLQMVGKELETRKTEQGQILRSIESTKSGISKLPVREQEMAGLLRDYEMSKTNYRSLLDKKFSAEMATDMERRQKSERFTIIDPAAVPMLPIKPNRILFGGLAICGGLVLGLALAFGNEMRRDVLLGEWELPAGTAILGRLPYYSIGISKSELVGDKRNERKRFRRGAQLAIYSSILLGLLGIAAAGIFAMWGRL